MVHLLPETITTERLLLRRPRQADAFAIFSRYGQDPAVSKYMVWRPLEALIDAETFIHQAIEDWEAGTRFAYIVELASNASGAIGMLDARLINTHTIDVGYVLGQAFWGRALMPEALSTLAAEALSNDTIFRVQATCDVDNGPSIRTLEKSGFVREGRLERFVVHPNINSQPRPCYLYARCR